MGQRPAPPRLRRFTELAPVWPGLADHLERIASTGECSVEWLQRAPAGRASAGAST